MIGGQAGGFGGAGGGGMGGHSALTWLGSDVEAYEAAYDVRSNDNPDAWAALINVCNVLNNTPLDQLADSLETVLDVDRALMYLAV
jgi:spore coat protein CotH